MSYETTVELLHSIVKELSGKELDRTRAVPFYAWPASETYIRDSYTLTKRVVINRNYTFDDKPMMLDYLLQIKQLEDEGSIYSQYSRQRAVFELGLDISREYGMTKQTAEVIRLIWAMHVGIYDYIDNLHYIPTNAGIEKFLKAYLKNPQNAVLKEF